MVIVRALTSGFPRDERIANAPGRRHTPKGVYGQAPRIYAAFPVSTGRSFMNSSAWELTLSLA